MSQIVALRHIALGVHFATQQALCNCTGCGRSTLRLGHALFSGRPDSPVSRHDARRNRRQLSVTRRWLIR
jgi:hypothetical protein